MPSDKRLNGITRDIAHHAASGLSFLHPHIVQLCRAVGLSEIMLDLTSASPLPADVTAEKPCVLSTQALHRTFTELLSKLGFTLSDVQSATLTFRASAASTDGYSVPCVADLVTVHGHHYHHEV
jgi:hypothetical protein